MKKTPGNQQQATRKVTSGYEHSMVYVKVLAPPRASCTSHGEEESPRSYDLEPKNGSKFH